MRDDIQNQVCVLEGIVALFEASMDKLRGAIELIGDEPFSGECRAVALGRLLDAADWSHKAYDALNAARMTVDALPEDKAD